MRILIKEVQIVEPAKKPTRAADILIADCKIVEVGKRLKAQGADKVIHAKGMIALPGLVDIHVHAREPGREDEETIATASRAAARGGFTAILCMANTDPPIDNQGVAEYVISQGLREAAIAVYPAGAVTKGLTGEFLTEISSLKKAGCLAISDDGNPIMNSEIMRRALEYSRMFGLPLIAHCEDISLTREGQINEGFMSTRLGLKGIPGASESIMVGRDLELARFTGGKLHIAHVSTKEAVGLIRQAKAQGVDVTCQTCPHYFTLTEEALIDFDTNLKIKPPLRTEADRTAIKAGLKDGTIDVIASDHAPHCSAEKDVEFAQAPFGMIGLETSLSLGFAELIEKKILSWAQVAEKMGSAPRRILGLPSVSIAAGSPADLTLVDPAKTWTLEAGNIASKSQNSPFIGKTLKCRVECTIYQGKIVFQATRYSPK